MGDTFMFLRLKFPQKGVLATCTKEVWDDYTEYLFGDKVWNFTTKGDDGQPSACPHQGIVEGHDWAIRNRVASLMSEGIDIEAAFDKAMSDDALRHTTFLAPFTIDVASQRCRALSAPAFKEIHGGSASSAAKRKLDDDGTATLTRSQKRNAARAKAKAKGQLALTAGAHNPGPGGGKQKKKKNRGTRAQAQATLDQANGGGGTGGGARNDKGAGKGKLKGKVTTGPNKGLGICYAFNNGEVCKSIPCNFAHVCQICEGDHAKGQCPNK